MKVFISSLIASMGPIRTAAREAVTPLRHEPVMAEDFGARLDSPQVACLSELRGSDLVVLILGESYGSPQDSGLSATHEEYRAAKGAKPVIAFVQEGVDRDPRQAEFVVEVEAWEGGLFRGGFRTADDLRSALTRALHDHALATVVGPVDEAGLVRRAVSLLPAPQPNRQQAPTLSVAVVGGPEQRLLRPIEMEAPALADALHQAALFGPTRVFDRTQGVQQSLAGASLVLRQEREGQLRLNEDGSVLVQSSVEQPGDEGGRGFGYFPVLVEEVVQQRLTSALAFVDWALEHIDRTQKITHVAVACLLQGSEHRSWVTQAEARQIAASGSMNMAMGAADPEPVFVNVRRAALRLDSTRLAEDLLVPLRRHWKRNA